MAETYQFDDSLVFEATSASLDGSGNYYSSWFATDDLYRIRVAIYGVGAGAVTIQHSVSSANEWFVAPPSSIPVSGGAGVAEVELSGRFWRLRVDTGTASGTARITIRAIERL